MIVLSPKFLLEHIFQTWFIAKYIVLRFQNAKMNFLNRCSIKSSLKRGVTWHILMKIENFDLLGESWWAWQGWGCYPYIRSQPQIDIFSRFVPYIAKSCKVPKDLGSNTPPRSNYLILRYFEFFGINTQDPPSKILGDFLLPHI